MSVDGLPACCGECCLGEFMSGGSSLKDTDFSNDTDLSGIEDDQSMFLVTHVLKEAVFFFFFFFCFFWLQRMGVRATNLRNERKWC